MLGTERTYNVLSAALGVITAAQVDTVGKGIYYVHGNSSDDVLTDDGFLFNSGFVKLKIGTSKRWFAVKDDRGNWRKTGDLT